MSLDEDDVKRIVHEILAAQQQQGQGQGDQPQPQEGGEGDGQPAPQQPSGKGVPHKEGPSPFGGDGKVWEHHFDTMSDFMDMVQRPLHKSNAGREGSRSSRNTEDHGDSWDAGVHYQEACKKVDEGWPEGTKLVRKASEMMKKLIPPESIRNKNFYEYSGGAYVDVGRYCSGDPEHFVQFEQKPIKKQKVITMLTEISGVCHYKANQFINRGAAMIAAIDLLEKLDYRVELLIGLQTHHSHNLHMTSILGKRANQPVEIDKLAFSIGHPAFFRRLWFSYIETFPREVTDAMAAFRSYGNFREHKQEGIDIYLHSYRNPEDFDTIESSVAWVLKKLEQQGYYEPQKEEV